MARRYEQRTYIEPARRGFFGTIFNVLKWLIIIGIILIVIAAL